MWNNLDLQTKYDLYKAYKKQYPDMPYINMKNDFNHYADGGTILDEPYDEEIAQATFASIPEYSMSEIPVQRPLFNNKVQTIQPKIFSAPVISSYSKNQYQQITPSTQTTQQSYTFGKYTGPIYQIGVDEKLNQLLDIAKQEGINLRVTSGLRPGSTTKQGKQSYHSTGSAIDIVPGEGETWETINQKFKNNPKLYQYLQQSGLGILDETVPSTMQKTGATGMHWHIGPDKSALAGRDLIFGTSNNTKPIYEQLLNENIF